MTFTLQKEKIMHNKCKQITDTSVITTIMCQHQLLKHIFQGSHRDSNSNATT